MRSAKRYFRKDMEGNTGYLVANALLNYCVKKLCLIAYDKVVVDVQERLQVKVTVLKGELFEDEFQFWRKHNRK